jgi:hypothetical protein
MAVSVVRRGERVESVGLEASGWVVTFVRVSCSSAAYAVELLLSSVGSDSITCISVAAGGSRYLGRVLAC